MKLLKSRGPIYHLKDVALEDLGRYMHERQDLPELNRIMRALLKAIIGQGHEYTYEEALFILREEQLIDQHHYDQLKQILLTLGVLSYSKDRHDLRRELDTLANKIVELLPTLLANTNQKALEIYRSSLHKRGENQFEQHHIQSKEYKDDIIKTERQISKQLREHIDVQLPFSAFFKHVVGYQIEKQRAMKFSESERRALLWDLFAKFFLFEFQDSEPTISRLQELGLSESYATIAVKENSGYLRDLQRYHYIRPMIKATLFATICLLQYVSIDHMVKQAKKNGVLKNQLLYVVHELTHKTP